MNLKTIDRACAAYEGSLDEGDQARLAFFRELWGVQDACARELGEIVYDVPAKNVLTDAYRSATPVFQVAPVRCDIEALIGALSALGALIYDSNLFGAEVSDSLRRVKWDRIVDASNPLLAGEVPRSWLEGLDQVLIDDGMSDVAARIGTIIASMALKIQLEAPSRSVMDALKGVRKNGVLSPLLCPVCGTAPMMAHVGGETSSEGRGRLLICPQCAAAWEFERIRCARCGTQNQGHLHFFNVEGDDAHRIATCDECGGYIRTLYTDDVLAICAYEVEDVVMARLDAIALNPEMAGGMVNSRL